MTRYILVDGTHGEHRENDWSAPGSEFRKRMAVNGLVAVQPPFEWTTALDGLWGKNVSWQVGGNNLFYHLVPPLCPERAVPSDELIVIAFSHGVQVALYAFAAGLRGRLISVCPPIRSDMFRVAQVARPNILRWLNLYGNWKDVWAVAGAIRDGHFGIQRSYPAGFCDTQEKVAGGHGAALRDPKILAGPQWAGWVAEVLR